MNQHPLSVLRIDASGRSEGSLTRKLADLLVARLEELQGPLVLTERDLSTGVPFVDQSWIAANFTDPADRSSEQREILAQSDELVAELKSADILVLAAPIYNFGVPAALKAWIDMIARARETFRYSEAGPVGLLDIRKAYLVVASGGTRVGSEIDFATGYLRHVLGFLGIDDVEIIASDAVMARGDEAFAQAEAQIESLTLPEQPVFMEPAPARSSRETEPARVSGVSP